MRLLFDMDNKSEIGYIDWEFIHDMQGIAPELITPEIISLTPGFLGKIPKKWDKIKAKLKKHVNPDRTIHCAISDIEKGIMERSFTLDETVFSLVQVFMKDPHLYRMLKTPEADAPDKASDIAIKMRDTVVRELSPEGARKLGLLIEKARREVGYE